MSRKDFKVATVSKNDFFTWRLVTKIPEKISVKIFDEQKIYAQADKTSGIIDIPDLCGQGWCIGEGLQLTLSCASDFNADLSSHQILDSSGACIARVFACIGEIGGNPDKSFCVEITSWGAQSNSLDEKQFISGLFYHYLNLKDTYTLNYISDEQIGELCADFDKEFPGTVKKYSEWFQKKYAKTTCELDDYRLIFATLMQYDKYYSGTDLQYITFAECLVMAFGPKKWRENKITFASCPFQNIRGVILNTEDLTLFRQNLKLFSGITLFQAQKVVTAASHGSPDSALALEATRGLNFQNCGIKVFSKYNEVQKKVISNSIAYAEENHAKILIFPELSINDSLLPHLESKLKKTKELMIVVAGSHYKTTTLDGKVRYTNTAPIYVRKDNVWHCETFYNKRIPFSMGYTSTVAGNYNIDTKKYPTDKYKLLVEDIALDDSITILPCKDCTLGVAICRDVMDLLDSHNPTHKYCDFVDILLVISDNTGDSNMFVGTAECLARWHNSATLYTNSINEASPAGTADSHLEISFGIYPYKDPNGSGSTSVSGSIAYATSPSLTADSPTPMPDSANLIVGLLYSKGTKYLELSEEEKEACCKIYEFSTKNP